LQKLCSKEGKAEYQVLRAAPFGEFWSSEMVYPLVIKNGNTLRIMGIYRDL
jgi:hypothetical protein